MPKRPSLFVTRPRRRRRRHNERTAREGPAREYPAAEPRWQTVLSIYLDPIAWRQLRELALDLDTSTQALGEEAINLLFEKHRRNRSA